jgi:hypothetical protein
MKIGALVIVVLAAADTAVAQCLPGNTTCLPSWQPTWNMFRSTVLYTCNNSGN